MLALVLDTFQLQAHKALFGLSTLWFLLYHSPPIHVTCSIKIIIQHCTKNLQVLPILSFHGLVLIYQATYRQEE